jgi:hypothetical protein
MAQIARIYLDACALSRLTDDPARPRIAKEADAIVDFFRLVRAGKLIWIASSALEIELRKNPDIRRREDALAMLRHANERHIPDSRTIARARSLHQLGYGEFDALHLAAAEFAQADILVTTDDRFLGQMRRNLGNPSVRAANPLNYIQEVKP